MRIDQKDVGTFTSKSNTQIYLGRNEETIEWCDKALKINPNDVFSIGNKGMALSNLGKDEEAIVWSD